MFLCTEKKNWEIEHNCTVLKFTVLKNCFGGKINGMKIETKLFQEINNATIIVVLRKKLFWKNLFL